MRLQSEQLLPVGQQAAWEALNDTEMLRASIAGCESIAATAENQYEVLMTASIGPVKAKFKGKLVLSEINPPSSYTMQFEGQGGPAGFGKGSAQVRLEAVDADSTRLIYDVQAQVGGKLAQIGSRLVDMAAQKMANDFFGTFNGLLQARYGKVAPPAPAEPTGLVARVLAWIRRLFGSGR